MENVPNKSGNVEVADETDTKPIEPPIISETYNSTHRGSIVSTPHVQAAISEENYDTSHPKRGIALVINQVKFKGMTQRDGSDRDSESVQAALVSNGFEVHEFKNLKKHELLAMLDKMSKKDHSQNDCLVVVVMTHGEKDVLYASDGSYPIDHLWEPFVGNACKSLIGKPKLFFVQACRGQSFDEGAAFVQMMADTVDARSSVSQREYVIPTMADILVMYSTYDGHYSWRNPVHGSWFIQSLSIELKENGSSKELLQLLTSVTRRVAYGYQSNVPGNSVMDAKKQIPCVVSMLTKALYFPPK